MSQTIIQRRYERLAASMKDAFDAQEAAGWPNEEVRHLSGMVLCGLKALAMNKSPHEVLVAQLEEHMDGLAQARSAAADATNVTTKTPGGKS